MWSKNPDISGTTNMRKKTPLLHKVNLKMKKFYGIITIAIFVCRLFCSHLKLTHNKQVLGQCFMVIHNTQDNLNYRSKHEPDTLDLQHKRLGAFLTSSR